MNEREKAAEAWMHNLPLAVVTRKVSAQAVDGVVTLQMPPLDVASLCRTYWGSHGCDKDVREPHDVHQCGLHGSTYGVCSQMSVTTVGRDRHGGWGGTASVRFWMLINDEWAWGDWTDNWTWFQ